MVGGVTDSQCGAHGHAPEFVLSSVWHSCNSRANRLEGQGRLVYPGFWAVACHRRGTASNVVAWPQQTTRWVYILAAPSPHPCGCRPAVPTRRCTIWQARCGGGTLECSCAISDLGRSPRTAAFRSQATSIVYADLGYELSDPLSVDW